MHWEEVYFFHKLLMLRILKGGDIEYMINLLKGGDKNKGNSNKNEIKTVV